MTKKLSHYWLCELFLNAQVSNSRAHRFAIEYHRSLRSKAQVKSVLDGIPGVGPARRKALMRSFGSIEDIRAASVEELGSLPEINRRAAEAIYEFFHKPGEGPA